jgi:tRNA U34 5-methylaminomethyl-2-thiouridine-forming methyltransferase MnmC
MEQRKTADGSITYYQKEVGDTYHSLTGAVEEARLKYAEALPLLSVKSPVILDICFGLGYNTAAALEKITEGKIICFENDPKILKEILEIEVSFPTYLIVRKFIQGVLYDKMELNQGKINLRMELGDMRVRIKEIPEKADFVFFDPFSPSKVPDMWTEDVFKDIRDKMNEGGRLATYSCAGWVRKNMEKAGFKVMDGPIVGRRSPGTIAIRTSS